MTTDRQDITAAPRKIRALIRKARRASFFIHGDTKLLLANTDSNLPLAPNVKVTRTAMVAYLDDIIATADHLCESRGYDIVIKLPILGSCYFI